MCRGYPKTLCQLLVLKIIWRVTLLYILPLGTDPTFEYFANNAVETPLYLAVGSYDAVKQILDTCPSSSHGGPDGKTALHATVLKEASKLFLQHGQISQRKHYKWNHCSSYVVRMLIRHSPDCLEMLDYQVQNFLHIVAALTCDPHTMSTALETKS